MRDLIVSDILRITDDIACYGPGFVLSLLDPGEATPDLARPGLHHTIVRCYDLEDEAGPDQAVVAAIRAFGDRVPDRARAIVHCHAGLSRSPAAALILRAHWGEPLEIGPAAVMPNARLLELADPSGRLAARGRELTEAAERHSATLDDWIGPAMPG